MAKEKIKVIKKWDNGMALFNNHMVRTPVGRLVFVNFASPKENQNDDGEKRLSYGAAILFKKGEDLAGLKLAMERFAKGAKGDDGAKKYLKRTALRSQDDKVDEYAGFVRGGFYFNASSKYPPTATDASKGEIDLGSFYSGCFARLIVKPYIYDRLGNRGVALGLLSAQFIRDGERLGGGGLNTDEVFDEDDSGESDSLEADDDGLL